MQLWMIFLPVLAALFMPLLFKKIKLHTGWFVFIVPVVLVSYYVSKIGERASYASWTWVADLQLKIDSSLDGLGLLFSILISGIGALVVLYSIFYLDKTKEQLHNFYIYLLLFMTAMLGVVQSDNVISLYLFWELTSISSFLLIGYWFTRDGSRFGALKSMMITVFGGLLMLGGFLILANITGTLSISEMMLQTSVIQESPYFTLAAVLVLLGALTKSAQFPFYIWLPDAMEAPTPVSAYLHSATMVKAGIYLVARFTPIFAYNTTWIWLIVVLGLITLFWGSFFATKQRDLKGILAFSTVSQLGMIMSMLGVAAMSYHVEDGVENVFKFAGFAALFHLINHSTFKGALFMIAGIIDHETGTRDIRKLGGLMSIMPISFTVAMIGSLSMAGLPPFNGFLSKELFFTTMLNAQDFSFASIATLIPVAAWIASIFTFVYCLYFVTGIFFGKQQELPKKPHEAPIGMLISPIILASFVVIMFFIPNVITDALIKPAVLAIQPNLFVAVSDVDIHLQAWHGFVPELWMTLGVIAVGFALFMTVKHWRKIYTIVPEWFSLNQLYRRMMRLADEDMTKLSKLYMTGSIRMYFIYMFAAIVVIVLSTLFIKDGYAFSTDNVSKIGPFDIALVVVLVVGTFTVLFARTRLTAIIALGVVGYSVAMFFVLFNAPDLALTQLSIETVSVALFLLAFYHLPKLSRHEARLPFKLGNFVIAAAVGVMVTLMALAAHSQKLLPSISEYYKETVYKEAGGGNIVNVILVDYRGFDTLFEITVLALAGMAIFGMIKLRRKKGEHHNETK
ncbi:Na+/H+ antiporter subunit A [Kurthia huakuii]|uniref:Na+/H+ antiporter subunit A n=1 Tax=Kurthia huakuii TaxID=1421019 RepID=UPI00049766F1|nr:Na+/H+ antiporter subunit A [Kurthia huakuii]MBM7699535.1 multicomponent Na+:H+ antiporter subunit A [Kurthia huakuii]